MLAPVIYALAIVSRPTPRRWLMFVLLLCLVGLGLTVTRVRPATGGHTQLTLRRDRDVLDGIAFGRPDIAEVVHEGDRLDVVARVMSRTFGGFESLQLEIRDVATSGSHPTAAAVLAALGSSPHLVGSAS